MTEVVCLTIIARFATALLMAWEHASFLDIDGRSDEPPVKDFILSGLSQGVALQYTVKSSALSISVALAIAVKLFVEFNFVASDIIRCDHYFFRRCCWSAVH